MTHTDHLHEECLRVNTGTNNSILGGGNQGHFKLVVGLHDDKAKLWQNPADDEDNNATQKAKVHRTEICFFSPSKFKKNKR